MFYWQICWLAFLIYKFANLFLLAFLVCKFDN
nr:MAG TPA: hypothetical protein [Caudoviricetes sp.]